MISLLGSDLGWLQVLHLCKAWPEQSIAHMQHKLLLGCMCSALKHALKQQLVLFGLQTYIPQADALGKTHSACTGSNCVWACMALLSLQDLQSVSGGKRRYYHCCHFMKMHASQDQVLGRCYQHCSNIHITQGNTSTCFSGPW